MFRILLILLVLSGCYSVNHLKGYQEIEKLSSSILLIQLEFPQKEIDLLNKMGFENKATKLQKKHERHHVKLAKAFTNFEFCKFYFYYSEPEEANLYDYNMKLYNEALSLVKFRLSDEPFYIAKFTSKMFDDGLDYEELKEGLRLYKGNGSAMPFGFPDFIPMTNYGSDKYYISTISTLDMKLQIFHNKQLRYEKRVAKRKKKNPNTINDKAIKEEN